MSDLNSSRVEVVVAMLTVSLMMMLWYFLWIRPHDEMVFWVMECMGSESGKELYEECHKKFLIHKGISPG